MARSAAHHWRVKYGDRLDLESDGWWFVTNGRKTYAARTEKDAEWLARLLNSTTMPDDTAG